MIARNDQSFLKEILDVCEERNIRVWVFGGWAEELCGLCSPRVHKDVDLLYPAEDFHALDKTISETHDWEEVVPKRFPHKRAVTVGGVMVEFFLVQTCAGSAYTDFFGRFRFDWPAGTFDCTTSLRGDVVNIASKDALAKYRSRNEFVRRAYKEYIAR